MHLYDFDQGKHKEAEGVSWIPQSWKSEWSPPGYKIHMKNKSYSKRETHNLKDETSNEQAEC